MQFEGNPNKHTLRSERPQDSQACCCRDTEPADHISPTSLTESVLVASGELTASHRYSLLSELIDLAKAAAATEADICDNELEVILGVLAIVGDELDGGCCEVDCVGEDVWECKDDADSQSNVERCEVD